VVPPLHPLFQDANRLRARWRIASGEPERARAAVRIADERIWDLARPGDMLLRAEASAAAGEFTGALEAVMVLAATLNDSPWSRSAALRGLEIVAQVPADPRLDMAREAVTQQLRARLR